MSVDRIGNIAFLTTFPPRECGLATFTQDLINELEKAELINRPQVIAVSDGKYRYDGRVVMELAQHDRRSYFKIADAIGDLLLDLLVIEHEYGIFGGEYGEYLLDLVENLRIPYVTTLHTVLSDPAPKQKEILKTLGNNSHRVIAMAKNTKPVLEQVYGVKSEKIEIIPHGVPYRALRSREALKEEHGLKGLHVISTFGLISPGKGLEYGIEAISRVVKKYPNVIYLVLGQTHPCVKRESGEKYREELVALVDELKLNQHVRFVDKYLSQEEIIDYLQMTDIYITPYLGKDQAVSGTLAYAVGYGRVVVSTPYSYAREMLAEGRGLLAGFKDAESLAKNILFLLENPEVKKEMEQRTLNFGKTMYWSNVANQYARLFDDVLQEIELSRAVVI